MAKEKKSYVNKPTNKQKQKRTHAKWHQSTGHGLANNQTKRPTSGLKWKPRYPHSGLQEGTQ